MAVENAIYSHEVGSRVGSNYEQDVRSPEQDYPKQLTAQSAPKHPKPSSAIEAREQLRTPSPSPSPRSSSPFEVPVNQLLPGNGTPLVKSGNESSGASHQFGDLPSVAEHNETNGSSSPPPNAKVPPPSHELDDILEEKTKTHRKSSSKGGGDEKVLKLSAAEMTELTSAPESLPMISPNNPLTPNTTQGDIEAYGCKRSGSDVSRMGHDDQPPELTSRRKFDTSDAFKLTPDINDGRQNYPDGTQANTGTKRPTISASSRAFSAQPPLSQWPSCSKANAVPTTSPKRKSFPIGRGPEPLNLNLEGLNTPTVVNGASKSSQLPDLSPPSPIPQSIPLPPMSIPTYLQLELSATRPSPLYIYRSASTESPYESSKVKFERLLNFLLLPPQLEQVLYFGSLACLDAWLYTFTILPLRFFKALGILISWWGHVLAKECRFITGFVYYGTSRMWQRRNERRSAESISPTRSMSRPSRPSMSTTTSYQSPAGRPSDAFRRSGTSETTPRLNGERRSRQGWGRRHRRMKSQPSSLSSYNKADLLQGAIIIFSSFFLMKLDASRMYHSIRAQSAIRLYVIYNLLEVCQII